ncbi:MAG TPA: 1,4-alpha-glucan branching protein GlgB [Candidatus Izemoplasmatales bacterium]|nr:1,4-alpha-glucan branching protein GlgB [Bacillota bacterium]HRY77535.1 1,4-alpha-glucan branching protein GlgB [Candidatus Izemoplasmatales bacterium]
MNDRMTELDLYLFHEGKLQEAWNHFGSTIVRDDLGRSLGVRFTVFAPHAKIVSVVGDFNGWDSRTHVMEKIDPTGVWRLFVPDVGEWEKYKFCIVTSFGQTIFKADPYAFFSDLRPDTCSKVYDIEGYRWNDGTYMEKRRSGEVSSQPMAIYEVHLGTWMTKPDKSMHKFNELVDYLIPYLKAEGFQYVELMPVTEHPLDESWGYQTTGYYSATSRYGVPKDLMYLIDCCHQNNIGVLIDWVPGHICKDAHGLYMFDGEPLYEYSDFKIRENEVWGTVNLDLGKGVTRSFLISNALFWARYFHVDGFRIDAVSNIIYHLGNPAVGTNFPAIEFLQNLSIAVKTKDPSLLLIAEDSTAFPNITKPVAEGGVGFDYKWNMGWMNDTLRYFEKDPIYRKYHHDLITFGLVYAFSERFVLPLSHDEVVHGKRSLVSKMPGDYWQKFANYRTLLGLQFTHPGKKLLFMGGEFAQMHEWKDKEELDWFLMQYPLHERAARFVRDLLAVYQHHKALFELDHDPAGFRWIDQSNRDQSIFSFLRLSRDPDDFCLIVLNMTPVAYESFRIGVPKAGVYEEILNSDKDLYGGSNVFNGLPLKSEPFPMHRCQQSLDLKVAPLSVAVFQFRSADEPTLFPTE